MELHIRPFDAERDYPALTEINNTIYPEYPTTEEEEREHDSKRDPEKIHRRFVAELDGRIVGAANFNHQPWMYHPHKFWVEVDVHPEYQRRGIGTALYGELCREMERHAPIALWAGAREDMAGSLRFLDRRGFKEAWRRWESRLDVNGFDFGSYAGLEQKVASSGIEITTFAALRSDPQLLPKIYELENALFADVPSPEPRTAVSYDQFLKWHDESSPSFLADAYFIALDGDQLVGMSNLFPNQANSDMIIGLTGVLASHRQRGIALALKLRGIAYAKEHGCPTIMTWNDSVNETMIAINVKMGFVRQPAWINLVKHLDKEEA